MKQNTEQLKKIREAFDKYVGDDMSWGARESIWDFFLPHLISSDEIKREAVVGFVNFVIERYGGYGTQTVSALASKEILEDFLTQSKEGGKE